MARTLYQKFRDLWKDKPDKTTPVTAETMMHIEQGIYDNSANIIELGKIVDGAGVKDISNQCNVSANGQIIEITIPIDGIFAYGGVMAGNYCSGGINFGSARPPMILSANISAVSISANTIKIEGIARLINTYASTNPQFGNVFDGNIEFVSLSQNSSTTCAGTIKMTFDLGGEGMLTAPTYTIYKSSQYYYPISELRSDLTERIEALEQRIAELEKEE